VAIDVLRQKAPDLLLPAGQFHGFSCVRGRVVERVFDGTVGTPADGVNRKKGRPRS
jgi:hypothetical protein